MKSIKDNISNNITIKNSQFICYLYQVNSLSEITNYLSLIKEEHHYANHHCYAYILDTLEKSSDDGEPSSTAGLPILNVLKSQNLNHILAIVVRYFGGIKLGASGLIRAYTKSITNAIEKTKIISLIEGYNINITFSYQMLKQTDYLLKNYQIITKSFEGNITYNLNIPTEDIPLIKNYSYEIVKNVLIPKD